MGILLICTKKRKANMLELDKIYHADCIEGMKEIGGVQLT